MLSHTWQVYPTFISTGRIVQTSYDDNLSKAFIAYPMFRGRDIAILQQLSRDNLHEIYDRLFDIDAEVLAILKDYYTTIADATESARDNQSVELDPQLILYLLEFYKIIQIGGANNPYACMEWPGIQIPQTILNFLYAKNVSASTLSTTSNQGRNTSSPSTRETRREGN